LVVVVVVVAAAAVAAAVLHSSLCVKNVESNRFKMETTSTEFKPLQGIITLNVGGCHYTTTVQTLTSRKDSFFTSLLSGELFVDVLRCYWCCRCCHCRVVDDDVDVDDDVAVVMLMMLLFLCENNKVHEGTLETLNFHCFLFFKSWVVKLIV